MRFATKEQIEEAQKYGLNVFGMTSGAARHMIDLAINASLAAKVKEMGLVPGVKIRRLHDGMRAEVSRVFIKHGQGVKVSLKGKAGNYTVLSRFDDKPFWEVVP